MSIIPSFICRFLHCIDPWRLPLKPEDPDKRKSKLKKPSRLSKGTPTLQQKKRKWWQVLKKLFLPFVRNSDWYLFYFSLVCCMLCALTRSRCSLYFELYLYCTITYTIWFWCSSLTWQGDLWYLHCDRYSSITTTLFFLPLTSFASMLQGYHTYMLSK